MNIDLLLDKMWKMYTSYTPSANQISKLFNEEITNDHIAFRTFNTEHLSINKQAKFLEQYGYYHGGEYDFKVKNLRQFILKMMTRIGLKYSYPSSYVKSFLMNYKT